MGSSAPKPNKRLPDAVVERAWRLKCEGLHPLAIAAVFNVSLGWGWQMIRRGRELEQRRQWVANHRKGVKHA